MLVCLVSSEYEGKCISQQCEPSSQPYFYNAFLYLLEFVRSVASVFENLVRALYFLLNAIVIASCELISIIFSYVKHAIKLLEFLVVSAWNSRPLLLELLYSIIGSLFRGIESLGKSIIPCSTSVCSQLVLFLRWLLCSTQAWLCVIGQNTLIMLNAILWAMKETFSSLITCSSLVCSQLISISKCLLYGIQVLLCSMGKNTMNMLNAIFWAISETFSTLITWSTSVCKQLIPISKWLLYSIQALLCAMGQNTLDMLNAIFWAISETFSTFITWSTSVCKQLIPISKWLFYSIQELLCAIGQNTLTMLNAIFWSISETSGMLITFSTSVYDRLIPLSQWLLCSIQALLFTIGQKTLNMLNAIFWAISETFSTLITCSTSVCNQLIPFSKWLLYGIQELLSAIGQNTLTILDAIFWAISETFSTLIMCSTSVCNQLIPFSKWLLYGIQALLCAIGQNTLTMLNAIFWAISETLSTLITCSSSVCNQVIFFSKWLLYGIQALLCAIGQNTLNMLNATFWAIRVIFSTLITELSTFYIKCIETLPNATSLAMHYFPNIGRWTVLVLALVGFLPIFCWVVFRVNVFSVTFKLLKTLLQGVLAFFAFLQVPSFPRLEPTGDEHEQLGHVPEDDRYLDLKEQLEREQDQNLCVVCQTERKNIVLIPCRHMCMCKNCCVQLLERYERKSCPLCGQIITSTMEIYA